MFVNDPLLLSRLMLLSLGTRQSLYHADRIPPPERPVLVVSNHRSFLDAPLLMTALNRSIRFACHHYMKQVPILRELVQQFGCVPLDPTNSRQQGFLQQAGQLLQSQQVVGIFPEGGKAIVEVTPPDRMWQFQRGFAHLALRSPVPELDILPVAISVSEETVHYSLPLQVFHWFDPSEPLFDRPGFHPLVVYHQASVLIGRPYRITERDRQQYRGKSAKIVVDNLTDYCQSEITSLLKIAN
ncbi:MAG: 1-acyl-sn-glycerol-3-phosphate acyltransferase [Cyanosarcina radialis HA8281-LM2]|jgi:1-acyl-sn-glycerol-3-phosphate acyltransferase|nr:1-acyl-sn-glycerol-3-phosphate acyltransferase [Cyanosarcina radialis HA8281-LM2]